MTRSDQYAASVYLKSETVEELKKAIEFYKQMEEDLDRDPKESKYRLSNMKFDRDRVIREVLKEFNDSK